MTAFKFIRPTTITDSAGSFARSTTATYFDVDGVMQTAAINVPRIGYDPVTHAHTGLMIEAAATNLLPRSAEFDHAYWSKGDATVTLNSMTAPDNTLTADKLIEAATSAVHRCWQNVPTTAIKYTYSVYVKAAERSWCLVSVQTTAGVGYGKYVNLSSGTIGSATSAPEDFSVQDVGNGWYRVTVTQTNSGVGSFYGLVWCSTGDGVATYLGDITKGIYVWGAQLETGSVATSYIPTTSAAVTRAADVVTGSGLIYTDVPEADYAAWVGGTTYTALTSYVIRTTATTHKVYQCLVTHTTAATPEDNTTGVTPKWLEIGPTNRWGMFDRKVGTETTQASSMTYLLKPGRANSLGLLGVDADSVEVSLISNGETVYVASVDLNSGNSVGDWYQYFYEPIYQVDAVAITNLLDAALMAIPAYGDGVLCVRFLATTGNVTCGVMAVGLYAELGLTQYEPTIGIIDYSRKSVDAFGNYDITERTYSKRMSATLEVDAADVDNTARLLTQYRATPVVWVGADNLYSSLIIYGFCKDWEETIKGPSHSICSIQIEGLT